MNPDVHMAVRFFASVVALLSGIVLTWAQSGRLVAEWEMRSWPTAEGVVVETEVAGARAFHPEVHYEYHVNGLVYRGMSDLDVPGFGTKSSRLNVAERTAADYPPGRPVTVHYDPTRPDISRLRIAPSFSTFMFLTIGVLLGAFSVVWLIRCVFRFRRHRKYR